METPILCWGIYRVLQGEWKRKWKLLIIIGCVQGLYRDNIWHKPIHMTYVVITVLSHTLCLPLLYAMIPRSIYVGIFYIHMCRPGVRVCAVSEVYASCAVLPELAPDCEGRGQFLEPHVSYGLNS